MPDVPTSPDALERRLSAHLRDTTATGPTPALDDVRRRGSRRRSVRRVAAGAGVVALLVGTGAVVATVVGGDRGDELVVSAPDATVTATDPTTGHATPETTAPALPGAATGGVWSATEITDGNSGALLLAWDDGFLAVENYTAPQPIGELTPEILELFPPDVRDLFTSQPSTIDEAIEVLQGHPEQLAAVQEIIDANPEVAGAIYGAPSPTIVRTRYSDDGRSWETVGELALPDGVNWVQAAEAHDGRLVVAGTGQPVAAPDAGEGAETSFMAPLPDRLFLAVTTDLQTWDVVHELDRLEREELPPGFYGSTWVQSVDVGPAGVIVAVQEQTNFEVSELLPADVRARLHDTGYGVSYDDGGVTVEIGGGAFDVAPAEETVSGEGPATTIVAEPSVPEETLRYTWDELGVDGSLVTDPSGSSIVWTGDPAGELSHHVVDGVDGSQSFVAAPQWGGFAVSIGGSELRILTSADGSDWTEQQLGAAVGAWPSALVEASDRLVLLANEGMSTVAWTSDGDVATWTSAPLPVAEDEVVDWVSTAAGGSSGAAVLGMVSPAGRGMPEGEVVVERDGFRLTVTVGAITQRFVVTGPGADGPETVYVDADGAELQSSDVIELDSNGEFRVLDPDTGDVVVSFQESEFEAAYAEAFPEEVDSGRVDGGSTTFALSYSVDGTVWTSLDRIGSSNAGSDGAVETYPVDVAVNGGRVVVVLETFSENGSTSREYRVYDV